MPAPRKLAPVQNMAALAYDQVPAVMAALATSDNPFAAQAVRFVILTASRMSEVLNAVWDKVDLENAVWVIAASPMKGRREHQVPLSEQVIALLRELPREEGNPFVFISSKTASRPITEQSVTQALRDAGCDATMHGFRSSFRDWAGDRTNFPREVAEAALAHAVGDRSEQAYRRGSAPEKRRKLMQAWARFCCTPPAAKDGAVVSLRRPG